MNVSPTFRRLGALAILLALLWGAWSAVIAPVSAGIAADGASIQQSRRTLADLARLEAALPEFEARLKDIHAHAPVPAEFIDGANAALAAAKLQDDLRQITAAAAVALRSSQTAASVKEGDFRRIGLELELGATSDGLVRLLHRIETATPALFIRKLAIRLPEDGTAPAAPDGQPLLTIRLELSAYQPEAAS